MTIVSGAPARETNVLIVGAGPVGLSLACEFGALGIDCMLVEKRDGSLNVPKMTVVSSRAMEFCRRWGIADEVRRAVWPESHALDIVYVTSLVGRELARVKLASYRDRKLSFTPEGPCHCPQIYFDPILTRHVAGLPKVALQYRTELGSFRQDSNGVEAELVSSDGKERHTIKAHYLVGCDGPAGIVRPALDIELAGRGVVADSVNIFFRSAELAALHDKGWARIYRPIDASGCWSELIPINGADLWRLSVFDDPAATDDPEAQLVKLVGAPFPFELLSVMPWERRDFVAQSFGSGRVFLAGDSAHQCSPTGGFGMHMGIEDAINLAWKIAAVEQGWGGKCLLSSYDAERRPIATRNVGLATRNYDEIMAIHGWSEPSEAASEPRSAGKWRDHLAALSGGEHLKIQYCYEGSPICVADGSEPIVYDPHRFIPSTRPGTRAPHGWLADGRSMLDLYGDGFVLLSFGEQAGETAPLLEAARRRNMPLRQIDIGEPDLAALYERRLVIVRPDGHVAWRADTCPRDPGALVEHIAGAATTAK